MEIYGGYKEQSYAGIVTNNHSNGILYKCKNYGGLSVDDQGAGICLNNSGTILYCENYGTINTDFYSNRANNDYFKVAGIALNNNGLIAGSINLGTLMGGAQAGICYQNTGNGIISNCYNAANLNWAYVHSSYGIVYKTVSGTVEYCYSIKNQNYNYDYGGFVDAFCSDAGTTTINECYNWYGKEYKDLGEDYISKWNEAQGMTIWKEDTEGINNGYPILNENVKYILEKEERTEVTVIMTVYDKNLLTPDINQLKEKILISIGDLQAEDIQITLAETTGNVLKVTVKAVLPQIVTGDLKVKLEQAAIYDKAGNTNDTIENVLNEEIKIQAKPSITVNVPTIGQKALLEVTNTTEFKEDVTWQWYAKENEEAEAVAIEGATTAEYELSAVQTFELEGYRIYCVATIEGEEYKSSTEILAINYNISTEEELIGVRDLVNAGKTLENKTVRLANNIEITAATWEPINAFAGIFDGQGNEISKLPNSLFGNNNGTIKNLGVNANIEAPSEDGIGIVAKENTGTIQNCYSEGSITGYTKVGGIVGINEGTIQNCYNTGVITGVGNNAGGIAGTNAEIIEACVNKGEVTGISQVGGIVGYHSSATDVITEIKNCYNVGKIVGNRLVGGIAGVYITFIDEDGEYFLNCYNAGEIVDNDESSEINDVNAVYGAFRSHGGATITSTNCYYNSETSGVTDEYATAKTTAEMKEPTFVLTLGIEGWKEDTNNINEGYPILKWQEGNETVIIEEQEVTQNSIKIKATATDVNYKYYKVSIDGQNYEEINVEEGNTYIEKEFTNLNPGTTYTVIVNAYPDNTYAEDAKIEGQKEIKTVFIPATITMQTVKVGYEATLNIVDADSLTENMTISWYRNAEDSIETGTKIEGATGAEYVESAANAVLYDNYYYYCNITINGTEYVSDTLKLTVDYVIETKEQLGKMRNLVNSWALDQTITGLQGKTVYLGNDIDLNPGFTFNEDGNYEIDTTKTALTTPEQWTPIGSEVYNATGFEGTFDGQNHTIKGIYINATTEFQGLFGQVGSFSEIKNLTVDGSITGSDNVGGIVGYSNWAKGITNCYNKASVTGEQYVGGIIGRIEILGNNIVSTIEKCYNEGTITGTRNYVGGIIGNFESDTNIEGGLALTNCSNEGTIKGELYVGGVIGNAVPGINTNDIIKITNCYNVGSITGTNYVGGIAGRNYSGTIANCYNEGEIIGIESAGGISGYIYVGKITNCYNIGTIKGNDKVGGILGQFHHAGSVENCYNIGVISAQNYVNAICGRPPDISGINNCYYNSETSGVTDEYATAKTTAEMKDPSFVELLGTDNWKQDTNNINGGFPILKWQN